MSIQPISVNSTPVLLPEDKSSNLFYAASVKTPPPPPPPPVIEDVVQLSLDASIQKLQSEGDSPAEIAQSLGVPVHTISVDLGTIASSSASSESATKSKV